MTSYIIPADVVEILNKLEDADRGQAFTSIFDYIFKNRLPDASRISPAALCAFEFTKRIIMKAVERFRKAEQRRALKKAEKESRLQSQPDSLTDGNQADSPQSPVEKSTESPVKEIPPKHIKKMRKEVLFSFRLYDKPEDAEKRDKRIKAELQRNFPGLYSDITYDSEGNVTLHTA